MGRNDDLPVLVLSEIGDEYLLIGKPGRACYEDKLPFSNVCSGLAHVQECLHCGYLLALAGYLQHTVEACIACHGDVVVAQFCQQLFRILCLDKEMCEASQHRTILISVPTEEDLAGTEDGTDAIDRHMAVTQDVEVVVPELILDEERLHRPHGTQETACVGEGIDGQVADEVCTVIVLPDLIARWREERQQYLALGMHVAILLNDGASLLKFSQRGSVKPCVFGIGINVTLQVSYSLTLTAPHLLDLIGEERCNEDTKLVYI